ncbi:hypothetical protein ElyMa_004466600 [Elysia marginata]|uniref:Uncharacterized protein n=1 Tax=Elysia marginata TaxID=1093978 RepID=A0AAV4HH18_9GAST|nr:hypothetical protein ElyMa_004466600 [Elysia marginata]
MLCFALPKRFALFYTQEPLLLFLIIYDPHFLQAMAPSFHTPSGRNAFLSFRFYELQILLSPIPANNSGFGGNGGEDDDDDYDNKEIYYLDSDDDNDDACNSNDDNNDHDTVLMLIKMMVKAIL